MKLQIVIREDENMDMTAKEVAKIFKRAFPFKRILNLEESSSYYFIAYGEDDDDPYRFINKTTGQFDLINMGEFEEELVPVESRLWKNPFSIKLNTLRKSLKRYMK